MIYNTYLFAGLVKDNKNIKKTIVIKQEKNSLFFFY